MIQTRLAQEFIPADEIAEEFKEFDSRLGKNIVNKISQTGVSGSYARLL